MDLGAPWAARMAYLLGIASEHRIDQLDPVGQAGGNHIAWAAGRPDPLVQVACSELSPVRAGSSQPAGQNQTQQVSVTPVGGANLAKGPSSLTHLYSQENVKSWLT